MKYLVFLLFTFTVPLVLGAQSFTGYMTKKGANYYLFPQSSENAYLVIAKNEDVTDSLKRLSTGDLVIGNGSLDTVNKRINLNTVDYVGLRRLLGPWVSVDGLLVFKDFSTMKFSPRRTTTNNSNANFSFAQKEFRYTLSPSDGDEWVLFLSDDKSTTFATVEFNKKTILMKLFESESGKLLRTLKLERP
jgi:hypothetical protein